MDTGVQLMHAGEEALFVLIPLAVVLLLDHRQRRKDRERLAALKREPGAEPGAGEPAGTGKP